MNKQISTLKSLPINNLYYFGPVLLLILALLFRDPLYGAFGVNNYMGIHLIMEILLIVASLTISVQSWLISPFILSNQRLYIGALFFCIGIIEIVHTISYKGMPYFFTESSTYTATWFYMIGRLTQAIGFLVILTLKQKEIRKYFRWNVYMIAVAYALVWILIIYFPTPLLPSLIEDGHGPTWLKIMMQFFAILLQIALIFYLIFNSKGAKRMNTMIILASVYLIISDIMFMSYKDVYDLWNFMGHLFQLSGFYYLIRALYYSSVEKPFQDLLITQDELENSIISLEEIQHQLEKSEEELHYLAYHDELTKLPNGHSLSEELAMKLCEETNQIAVLMLEIDRLQFIKESLGQSFSNLMLQKLAIRLKETLPNEISISKLHEGEFVIVIPSAHNSDKVEKICVQIQNAMKTPFQIQHFLLNGVVNIGIAVSPSDGILEEELLKHAQVAMREAQTISSRYMFYQPSMEKILVEKLILEQDLHLALEKNELFLNYQPKVNLQTGMIDSVEALVRWNHSEKGLISPTQFVPIAEASGLIVPIGEWIIEKACRQTKIWQDEGLYHLGVAVNLSIRQFYQQDLVEMVGKILAKTGLQAHFLELEITESMTINTSHALEVLNNLKALGVKIAVDDFGTGYSSLSYLKDFPIDCLKIDRSFVKNIQSSEHDGVLILMIISMAKHMGLKVVAEGVEELEQFKFLSELQCDWIQGYLFSKPLSPEVFASNYYEIQNNALSIMGYE